MKTSSMFLCTLCFVVLGVSCAKRGASASPRSGESVEAAPATIEKQSDIEGESWGSADVAARASIIVRGLSGRQFEGVAARFNDKMSEALPKEKLAAGWAGLLEVHGAWVEMGEPQVFRADEFDIVEIPCRFEEGEVIARVVFDDTGRVAGLFYRAQWSAPAYADQSKFEEIEVHVGPKPWSAPGVLAVPRGEGPVPAVILVHGSGPSDRDETHGPNKVFKDLAWGLASRGIAVLRYDKRTFTYKEKLAKSESFTPVEEYVDDAVEAAAMLSRDPRIVAQRIFVLGHSAGARWAPRIAAKSKDVAGFVSLAGSTRDFETTLISQIEHINSSDGEITDEEEAYLAAMRKKLDALKNIDKRSDITAEELPFGIPAPYWRVDLAYNPVKEAKKLKVPMLILQGERDYQVTMDDFALWKRGLKRNKKARFISYPSLNHQFVAGEGKSVPAEYGMPGHVSEQVVEDIAKWITREACAPQRRNQRDR